MTKDVAIAISAFRSDDAVNALLASIFADPHDDVASVIVVDSLGSGAVRKAIIEHAWPVTYVNSAYNLGSAGNLAARVMSAHDLGASWCLCLNHDASWSADRLNAMLKVARADQRVGAVYPLLDHAPRERRWEDGRRSFDPVTELCSEMPKRESDAEVMWSSSNGALYSTAPYAEGIKVMDSLWMGYEDLAYGLGLWLAGWKQMMCRDAVLSEIFDYRALNFLGRRIHVPDKPAWYQFYDIRNLLLIRRRYGGSGVSLLAISRKFCRSLLRIILLEREKATRLRFLIAGLACGMRGSSGKWIKP